MKTVAGLTKGDEKNSRAAQTALAELGKLKYGSIVSSFSLGSAEEGALRSVTITEVEEL